MLFLSNDLHEKGILKSQDKSWRYCGIARAIYNLPSCYNIAFVFIKKCTCFQPIISALFLRVSYCDDNTTLHNVAFEY